MISLDYVIKIWPTFIPNLITRIKQSHIACRFAKGAFWSMFGATVSRGFTLLASIIVARFFGKTVYGELGIIQSTIGTVGIFAGIGLGISSTKYVANLRVSDPKRAGRIIALSSVVSLITASVVSIALIFSSSLLAKEVLHAPHLRLPITLAAGLLFFGVLNGVQTGALAGFEAFQAIAKTNLIAGLSSFPLTIIGAWLWGISGAVLGMTLSMAVNWSLNNRALRSVCQNANVPIIYHDCWAEKLILWKFTLPAALSGFITAPIIWLANVMLVNGHNGYAEMGIFSAAQQWQSAILFLPLSLAPMVLSLMASSHGEGKKHEYTKLIKVSLFINAAIAGSAATLVSLLSPIIMMAYGKDFSSGWLVLSLLAITAVLIASSNVIGQVIASSDLMWRGFLLNLFWATLFIGFSLLWTKSYGAIGLALSYMAAYLCHLIMSSIYLLFIKHKESHL